MHFAKTQVQLPLDQKSSFPRKYGINAPLSFSEDRRGRGKAGGQGDGEVCRRGGCKVNEANDNRIYCPSNRAFEGCCLQYPYCPEGFVTCIRVHFAKTQVQLPLDQKSSFPRIRGITLPLAFSEGRRGRGKAEGKGDGEVCRRGRCKVHEANDNRCKFASNRAIEGCRLRHTYDHEGLCRTFGCTLRRHKCNCPWIRNLVSPVNTV